MTQAESRTPTLVEINSKTNHKLNVNTYVTDTAGLGTIYRPLIENNDNRYFLASGDIETIDICRTDLLEFLHLEDVPVRIRNSNLCWSYSISESDLPE